MKQITKTEEQCLRDHVVFEDRKDKKLRIIFLLISACFALFSSYYYFHNNEIWRFLGSISFIFSGILWILWLVSIPQKLKRLIQQGLSFQEIEEQLFEENIQVKTFKDLSPAKQEEMMQKLRNEFNAVKEHYDGDFKLRDHKDDYDAVANLLIIDMYYIESPETFIIGIGEKTFNIGQYYNELFNKTTDGIEFVEDYINGRVFYQEEEIRQQYVADKKRLRRKKQLPYFIAIGIGLLFLLVIICRNFFI